VNAIANNAALPAIKSERNKSFAALCATVSFIAASNAWMRGSISGKMGANCALIAAAPQIPPAVFSLARIRMQYSLADFDYPLPPELIAQSPAPERTGSRLLHLQGAALSDRSFTDLPQLLRANDLLILNDTRVIKARLLGSKETGGKVEVLIERLLDDHSALAQVRASKTPTAGSVLSLGLALRATVEGREGEFFRLRFGGERSLTETLEAEGELPLPPYIEHAAEPSDQERYQTVYAREPGAVAAPTAGLHFDTAMIATLAAHGINHAFITLHVGAGTFQPVRTEDLSAHHMHSERYAIPQGTVDAIKAARLAGGRVVCVGTTSLRALEAAAAMGEIKAGTGDTALFITPGYRFRAADLLLTNFHLPRSTLLMLVSAFAGMHNVREAYKHAIAERYRFFSYGDCMLLEPDREQT
jgi:S-adenosylmethionine:tRNA ribosyltransferase-isomerase